MNIVDTPPTSDLGGETVVVEKKMLTEVLEQLNAAGAVFATAEQDKKALADAEVENEALRAMYMERDSEATAESARAAALESELAALRNAQQQQPPPQEEDEDIVASIEPAAFAAIAADTYVALAAHAAAASDASAQVTSMRAELDAVRSRAAEHEVAAASATMRIEGLRGEVERLHGLCAARDAEAAGASTRVAALCAETASLWEELEAARKLAHGATADAQSLEQQLEAYRGGATPGQLATITHLHEQLREQLETNLIWQNATATALAVRCEALENEMAAMDVAESHAAAFVASQSAEVAALRAKLAHAQIFIMLFLTKPHRLAFRAVTIFLVGRLHAIKGVFQLACSRFTVRLPSPPAPEIARPGASRPAITVPLTDAPEDPAGCIPASGSSGLTVSVA